MTNSTTPSRAGAVPPASEQGLLSLLQQLSPISEVAPQYQRTLATAAQLVTRGAGEKVINRAATDDCVLYLVRGAVVVRRPNSMPKLIEAVASPHPGIVYEAEAEVEVTATKDSVLLRIPHAIYVKQLRLAAYASSPATPEVDYLDNWQQLDGLERSLSFGVLAQLPMGNVHKIVSRMEEIEVAAGTIIFKQGASADFYYLVKSGTAEVSRIGRDGSPTRLAIKVAGDAFGDDALIIGAPRNATLRMLIAGSLLRMSPEDFRTLIHEPLCNPVALQAALDLTTGGARLLDLRDAEAFTRAALPGALNIPLFLLRSKLKTLDAAHTYITYSNTHKESELGCYLLAERGLTAYFIAESIPHISVLNVTATPLAVPQHLATVELEHEVIDAAAAPAALRRLPEVPPLMLRELIEAERKRYDRLLATRSHEIRAAAERSLREQLQPKLAQIKSEHQVLLDEARKLHVLSRDLEMQRLALEAQKRAFEAEKAALRIELGSLAADQLQNAGVALQD